MGHFHCTDQLFSIEVYFYHYCYVGPKCKTNNAPSREVLPVGWLDVWCLKSQLLIPREKFYFFKSICHFLITDYIFSLANILLASLWNIYCHTQSYIQYMVTDILILHFLILCGLCSVPKETYSHCGVKLSSMKEYGVRWDLKAERASYGFQSMQRVLYSSQSTDRKSSRVTDWVTNPNRREMGLTKVKRKNRDKAKETDSCFLPKYSHKLLVSVCQPSSTSPP